MNKKAFKIVCGERGFDTTFHKDGRITVRKSIKYRSFNQAVTDMAKDIRYLKALLSKDGYKPKKSKTSVNERVYTVLTTFSDSEEEE